MPIASPPGFHLLDWIVVASYAAVLLGIGAYYSRRQKTAEEYFNANRNVKPVFAGISLFAAMLSTISYIAIPGEMVQNGPVMAGIYICTMPFTYLLAGWLLIPCFMRLPITSAYELLDARLGRTVRLLASLTFIVTRLVWMALVLYTMSTVVVNVMGWDPRWVTPVTVATGLVTTIYTLGGGLEGVVIADVLQFFVLLAGAVLALVCISIQLGGVGAWWPQHWMPHWAPQPFFSADPHTRVTVVGTLVSTIVWWVCAAGSDQMAIQRYLMTRDVASARRAFLHNNIADATVTLVLGLVGLALMGFYRVQSGTLSGGLSIVKNGDALFSHYISHYLPMGACGLIVSGLLAAGMSTLSSAINSTITVFSKDIVDTLRPDERRSEAKKVHTARLLTFVIGIITVAGSSVMGAIHGNLLEVSSKTINLFVYPMFGFFFLALFVPFATPFGAILGALYSLVAAVVVGYWGELTGGRGLSFQWIAPASFLVSLSASCGFSLLPTRGRSLPVLLLCGAVVLAPLAGLLFFLVHRVP